MRCKTSAALILRDASVATDGTHSKDDLVDHEYVTTFVGFNLRGLCDRVAGCGPTHIEHRPCS